MSPAILLLLRARPIQQPKTPIRKCLISRLLFSALFSSGCIVTDLITSSTSTTVQACTKQTLGKGQNTAEQQPRQFQALFILFKLQQAKQLSLNFLFTRGLIGNVNISSRIIRHQPIQHMKTHKFQQKFPFLSTVWSVILSRFNARPKQQVASPSPAKPTLS